MLPSEQRIQYLLRAYTRGTATASEEEELYRWVSETPDDTPIKRHIERLLSTDQHGDYAQVDWERLYQKILHQADIDESPRPSWLRPVAAAAVIVLLITAGTALFLFRPEPPAHSTSAIEPLGPDIAPGGNKALLQAGNQQVVLHSGDTSFSLGGNRVHINNGNIKIAHQKAEQYTLITPKGGTYKLVLSDGTQVWLNADSKLQYPSVFTASERQVSLRGEAYFEVKTDAGHPFIVHTPGQHIRVLGTAFNIHAYGNENRTLTTLVDGKVQIKSKHRILDLHPGQQAELTPKGNLHVENVGNIDRFIAWKNGYFRFVKADIRFIMKQLARWYDIQVHYSGKIPDKRFGAFISRDNNISAILKILEATGAVHFKIQGREITVFE